ncbi:hypothetical protein BJ166DRAFT_93917 [Pestalotiopsis sp. NC0098]|nr:hypothetical protein BJ166DRAFT_93917 [Pestalotiopsis sp. NC0098]
MAAHRTGTLLRIAVWLSSQLVLLASAHQDEQQWARSASISSYIIWLVGGVWLVLTDLDIVVRRPGLVAIPPFLLYLALITLSKAGLTEAIAIMPTAVNIGTVIILEWECVRNKPDSWPAQYRY